MAEFSTPKDVKDAILAGVSQEEDHLQAERAIRIELAKKGYNADTLPDAEVLKDLSLAYACWQRCILEMGAKDDAFTIKAPHYKAAWEKGVSGLKNIVDQTPVEGASGGGSYGAAELVRE
jgi:hypothetical protein